MPEKQPQPAAFDPANFALPTSDQPTLSYLQYTVVANSDHAELSCYTQHLYQLPDHENRPGGTFSDQAEAAQSQAHPHSHPLAQSSQQIYQAPQAQSYQAQPYRVQEYRPSFAPPQSAATPNALRGRSLNFSDQAAPSQPVNNYSFTDGQNQFQQSDNFASGEAQSFAPPANRSSIPYMPRTDASPNRETEQQLQPSTESLTVSTPKTPKMILVGQGSQESPANQTKLVDLRNKKTQPEAPTRDQNTVATQQPEFLDRKEFSSKFSETTAKSPELTHQGAAENSESPLKTIYLKSITKEEQPGAQLVEPTFEPAVLERSQTSPTEQARVVVESPFAEAPAPTMASSPWSNASPQVFPFSDLRELDTPTNNVLVVSEAPPAPKVVEVAALPQTDEAPQDVVAEPAPPSFATSNPFQSTAPPTLPAENSVSSAVAGFTDSDFLKLKQEHSVKNHTNDGVRSNGFSSSQLNSLAASTPSQKNPFGVASFRRPAIKDEATFSSETVARNIASRQNPIVLPRLEVKSYRTASTVNQQLIAATTEAPQPVSPPAEMGWLSPWWMIVGLIPVAMYLATTRLFRDDEFVWEDDFDSPIFGSDNGVLGGSKSDAIYGTDAESPTADYVKLDEEFRKAHAAIPFAEPIFFDLPSVEEIKDPRSGQELSPKDSPNFGADQRTKKNRQGKKQLNRKHRKRKAS